MSNVYTAPNYSGNIIGVPMPYEVLDITPGTRVIIVQDDDSEIMYSTADAWSSAGGLHTMTSRTNFASFSYNFTGLFISVVAFTKDGLAGRANATYSLQCLVDGENISELYPITTDEEKSVIICSSAFVSDKPPQKQRSLVVNFSWDSNSNIPPLGIDYLLVNTESDSPSTEHDIVFAARDWVIQSSVFQADLGWEFTDGEIGTYHTSTSDSVMTFPFTGVSVTWNGYFFPGALWTPYKQTGRPVPATYTVDQGDTQPFDTVPELLAELNGNPPNYEIYLMQKLFQTPTYPYGDHTLRVTFHGNDTITPLTLHNIVVQATPIRSAPTSISSSQEPVTGGAPGSRDIKALLAGSVGGGSVALILTILVFFLLRRRRRHRKRGHAPVDSRSVPDLFITDMRQSLEHRGPRKTSPSQHYHGNPLLQELQNPPVNKWTRHLSGRRRERQMSEPLLPTLEWASATGVGAPLALATVRTQQAPPNVSNIGRSPSPQAGELTQQEGNSSEAEGQIGSRSSVGASQQTDVSVTVFPPMYTTY